MNNRLFKKIFLSVALSISVGIMLVVVLLSVTVSTILVNEKESILTNNCSTISKVISGQTDDPERFFMSVNAIMRVASDATSGDVYISDRNGHVFICSCVENRDDGTCNHTKGLVSSEIIKRMQNDESYFEVGSLDNRLENVFYTASTPFYNEEGSVAGYIFISSPASSLKDMWAELFKAFVICMSLSILVMFLFLYFTTKKLTKPIKLMSKAAAQMSKGDFSNRIPVEGNDEITDLSIAFNAMSNSLSQLEGMRRSFVANVSHELRTPMTTIGGFIDGILDGTIPPDKQEYYLSIVSSEVTRLTRLVHTMLNLSRLESGEQKVQPTEFSALDLICEVLSSHEQRIEGKSIQIEGLEDVTEVRLVADRDLIYQAVYNLTDNAIKFTDDGGTINYLVSHQSDSVHIKVKNSGKGIEPSELQYVFDRFYKADKSRSANKEGTGLGLYIVKTIVDIHGGSITVSSKLGEFTEFEIILPQIQTISERMFRDGKR